MQNEEIRLTPMMRQYYDVKRGLPPDAVLLYRLGDFYELFFEDACKVAPILDITLTRRASQTMCGIPYHALDAYLPKLLEAGLKVAIAEQTEDPRQVKGIVKRSVTRIITPGTVSDASLISNDRHNFLAALLIRKEIVGIAALDLSTGDFTMTQPSDIPHYDSELNRLSPREIIIPESLHRQWESDPAAMPESLRNVIIVPLADYYFAADYAEETLKNHFKVAALDAFGWTEMPVAGCAAGAILDYVTHQLRQKGDHIRTLRAICDTAVMSIDPITLRHLELTDPLPGHTKENTLLHHIDHTVTPMGTRLIRDWMLRPLSETRLIRERHEAVELFTADPLLLTEFRETLSAVRDLERITARINLGYAVPRDFIALQQSLAALPDIRLLLETFNETALIATLAETVMPMPELSDRITRAISDQPPNNLTEGGIIREGYHPDLDTLRRAASEGKQWLADVQVREQKRTGIKSLKVQFNRVFGYFIEISKANLHLVPDDYTRKQTTVNAERFITAELKELESTILGAEEKAKALEQDLFIELRTYAATFTATLQKTAKAIAGLDVVSALAELAQRHRYIRPVMTDEVVLDIRGGRHPILDITMKNERFVPNDTCLNDSDQRIMIITGPNMAGKSTYIRQTALLTIMAQMGSFIPADSAVIGIADRVFTRIGAADDIARGQSTFMVEMVETANILNHATARSLVILDEIGRGTSTFDGLAIAWAVAEHLHNHPTARPRTQFATHYHELTELAIICPGIKNFSIAVREYGEQIIFLRQIIPGAADKSYGIHVARLAGLPQSVITRAFEILDNLERHAISASGEPVVGETRAFHENDTVYDVMPKVRKAHIKADPDTHQLRFDF